MKISAFKIYFFQETMSFVFKDENFWELQLKWSLLFFLKIYTCVLLNNIDEKMCGKFFLLLFNWKILKKIFRFFIITKEQNKANKVSEYLQTLQTLQGEYMLKILEENNNLYLTNRQ